MQDKVSLPRVSTTLHTAAAAAEGGGGAGGAKKAKASGADDASARLRPALATFAAAVRGTDGALLAGGAGAAFRCAVGGGGGLKPWPRRGPNDGTNWTGVGVPHDIGCGESGVHSARPGPLPRRTRPALACPWPRDTTSSPLWYP